MDKIKFMMSLILAGASFITQNVSAAIPTKPKVGFEFVRGVGSLYGGQARSQLGLLDIRRTSSAKKKIERYVFDFGTADLRPTNGLAGYYHVEVSDKPSRISIELPQVLASRISETDLQKRIKGSEFVKRIQLQYDRSTQSTFIHMQTYYPVTARVAQVKNQNTLGKMVLDLMPVRK